MVVRSVSHVVTLYVVPVSGGAADDGRNEQRTESWLILIML